MNKKQIRDDYKTVIRPLMERMISELKEGGKPHNDIINDTREVLIDIAMEMNTVKKSDGSIVNSRRAAARLLGISAATVKAIQFKK